MVKDKNMIYDTYRNAWVQEQRLDEGCKKGDIINRMKHRLIAMWNILIGKDMVIYVNSHHKSWENYDRIEHIYYIKKQQ